MGARLASRARTPDRARPRLPRSPGAGSSANPSAEETAAPIRSRPESWLSRRDSMWTNARQPARAPPIAVAVKERPERHLFLSRAPARGAGRFGRYPPPRCVDRGGTWSECGATRRPTRPSLAHPRARAGRVPSPVAMIIGVGVVGPGRPRVTTAFSRAHPQRVRSPALVPTGWRCENCCHAPRSCGGDRVACAWSRDCWRSCGLRWRRGRRGHQPDRSACGDGSTLVHPVACSSCHGEQGKGGVSPDVPALTDVGKTHRDSAEHDHQPRAG
jgi:hypothetical protein